MNVLIASLIVSFIFSFGQHLTVSDNVDKLWNKKNKEDVDTNQDLQATIITPNSGLLQYNKSKEHHIISTYETKPIYNGAFSAQSIFGSSARNHTTKPKILSRRRYIVQDKTTSFIPNKHNIGKLILRLKRHISSLTDDPGGAYYKIQNHSFPNDILRGYKTADLENQEFNSCILNCTLSKQKNSDSISDDPEDINTQCKENCFAQVFNNCISKCTKITDSNSDIHIGPLDIGRLCKSNCSTKILNECISNCTLHKIQKLDNSIFNTKHSLSHVNDQNRSFKILHSSNCTVSKLQSENFLNISKKSGLDFDGLVFNCSSLLELCSNYNDSTLNTTNCFCLKLLTSCSSSDYVGIVLSSINSSFNLSDMFNSVPNLFASNCTLHSVSHFNIGSYENNNTDSKCALNCSVQVVGGDCSSDTNSDIEISCIYVTLMNMDRNVNHLADVNIKHITNLLTRNYFHDKDLFLDLRMTNCSLEEVNDFTINCTDQNGYNVLCNQTNSKKFSNSVLEIGDSYTQKSLLAEHSLILRRESSVGNACHGDCNKMNNGYSSTLSEKPVLLSDTSQQEPNVSISSPEKNGSSSLCQDDCPGEELPQGDDPIDGEPSVADLEALCQPCHQVCHYRQNAPVRCGCYHGFAITSNWLHCIDVDECSLHPQLCHGGWCLNIIGSFMCHCPPGYQLVGHTCIDLDECQAHVCDQVCINVPGSYRCWCRSGFQPSFPGSRSCADIDECQHPVCSHACINTVGSFFCHCPSGWRLQSDDRTCLPSDLSNGIIESAKKVIILKDSKNPHEETSITFTKSSSKSGRRMVVLNSDREIPNNPVLKNVGYSSFRTIPSKMERNSGERQEKQLKSNVGGSATRNILTREVKFDCDRHPTSCSTERYKPCVPSCKNGGVCNGKGVCHCTAGFQGRYCQIDRNECSEKPPPCSYMCINSFGGYQCICPSGQVLADDGKSCVGAATRSAKTLSVLIEVVVEPSPTATFTPTYPFPEHTVFNTGVGAFLPHKGLTVENLVTEVVNKSGVTVPDKSSLPVTSDVVREESNSTFEKIQPTKVLETVVSSDLVLVQVLEDNSTSSDTSSQVNFTLFSTVFESSSELTASFDGLVNEAEPLDVEKQGNFTGDVLNITAPPALDELKILLPISDGTGNLIMSSDNGIIAKSDDGPFNLLMPSSSLVNGSDSILLPTDISFSHTPVLPIPARSEILSNLTVVLSTSQVLMPDSSSSETPESLFVTSTEDDSDGKIGNEISVKNGQLAGKVTKPRKNKQKEDKLKGGKEKDKLKVKKKHKTKIKVVKLTKDFQILNLSSIQEEVKNPSLKSVAGMKEMDSGARYFEVIDYDDDSFLPLKYNSSNPFSFVPPAVVPAPLPTHATGPHLNEKDCYYGSNRIKSRTSFYRDNNNCTKCVCKDGELRCAPRHCPPLHCEVPLHGDCCDYCPSDCVVDRDVYLTGERFSPALDPCRECRCKSGRAVCDDIKCQALDCPEQFRYLLPGECCPVCKPPEPGCFSRGRFFYQGQLWVRQEGGCHACLCKDGEIQCNPVVCVVNCQHPQFIPGECCPLCEGCQHYNQKYSDQQMFPHPTDPCSICQCQNGNISCYHKPCSSECSHPYQSPGECCPQCVDCNFSGQRLRNASSIAINLNGTCQECSCVLGNVSCAPSPCTASCVVEGKELPSGTEFNLGSDACTHCRCTNGVVSCQAVECASTCSHGVLLPDTCCLDCSKCDYQGRLFSEMEVFRPLDESCKSCLCVKGNVICQDTCSLSPLD